MRKVIVNEWMTLGGVVQAPGAPDEDRTGGFEHGGWHMRYFDDLSQQRVVEGLAEAGGFLLGRRTCEIFAAYWPNAPEEEQVVAEPLNTKPKHVVSATLSEPLAWQNSTLLQGEVAEAVGSLKEEDGADHGRDPGDVRSGRALTTAASQAAARTAFRAAQARKKSALSFGGVRSGGSQACYGERARGRGRGSR